MTSQSSAGGAGAAGGMEFQHRVAAWVAARILAEQGATPPWDLPGSTTLDWLRCEADQPVDDLLVGTSQKGRVFTQIKRSLNLSSKANSELASVLDQFVRQFFAGSNQDNGARPNDRPLAPEQDRLLLITSSASPESVRIHLRNALRRARHLTPDQTLDSAAQNKDERRALSMVRDHILRLWQALLGRVPSDQELHQLLSLIHIQVLDVGAGETGEYEAKDLLRSAVLRDPGQVDQAWTTLVELCAGLATQRSGRTRTDIQRQLLNAGLDLRISRSYENDIERLGNYSEQTLKALAHLAEVRLGSATIKVPRACTEELKHAVETSLLVVGEPGAGKSGALYDFVAALREDHEDYVFLAVDRVAARSLGELREELGLEHDLPEVLDNRLGRRPAFLVIDALDAARENPAGQMVRDLIGQVVEKNGRWRVVASVRKFDLRYGVDLQHLFAGNPPTRFVDPEFQHVRHLNVPRLSDEEVVEIGQQSSELQQLIDGAPTEFRDLLRVPFNLRLLAELLGTGLMAKDLTPIKTQLELLEYYWRRRVVRSDGQGDAREVVLREACEGMVAARRLRIDRSAVAHPDTSALLNELLSTQVLTEWQASTEAKPDRYSLAFPHHVLFDYAVARLLFQGDGAKLIRRLEEDPELVIVIRPSLVLHFRHVWGTSSDRQQFWDLVFRVFSTPSIPEVGKLMGPAVAAEMARTMGDLEPLCEALEEDDTDGQGAAEQAFRHLVGALVAGTPQGAPLVGPQAGPWCELLERVSRNLRTHIAYTSQTLLTALCDHPEDFPPDQRAAAGEAARRILEFAWSQHRDSRLVIRALPCVCRTFESDPDASESLIRRAIEPSHLSQYGFEELFWLAREATRLVRYNPTLVMDIYCAAFGHQEESEEPTPMGSSHILPLVSSRRQDYETAQYQLARAFPGFLESASEQAMRALIRVLEAHVIQRHAPASRQWQEEVFDFDGREAHLRSDNSAFWDAGGTYRNTGPMKMLDAFQRFVEGLATTEEGRSQWRRLVEIIVSENRLAILWRRLLRMGARFPENLGREILPLAWARPILTGVDTADQAGEYLTAIFPIFKPDLRQRIERAILDIPERDRDRLLKRLAPEAIVTDEARQRLEELRTQDAIPPNEPLVRFEQWSAPYGEEQYLRNHGVPVDAEPNRVIRELERPVKEFADRHLNSTPTVEEAMSILPTLRDLYEAVCRAEADGVHPMQRDYALGIVSAACARMARIDDLSCDTELGTFVKDVLLEATRHPEPAHDPEHDAQFDEHPSWGSPAPRIEAAEGLITLARYTDCATSNVLTAIAELSTDPVPAVRYQIADRLNALYYTAPEIMWPIIERMAQWERSRGVLQGLLASALPGLARVEPNRVAAITKTIWERITEGPGASLVRDFCVNIFLGLHLWRDHPLSQDIIVNIVSQPASHSYEASHMVGRLREALTHGPTGRPDPQADAVRRRALGILHRLLSSTQSSFREIENRHALIPFSSWPKSDRETVESLSRLIDHIGREVYFASGAYDATSQGQTHRVREVSPESRRFYQEAGAIIDELADAAFPNVAHHLLETLEYFVPLDPRGVFLRIHRVVSKGQRAGYQYESLAADLVVRLVERYLAEHRTLLQEDQDCRKALLEVLDVFVKAGWPSAQKLVYRLEEIFR